EGYTVYKIEKGRWGIKDPQGRPVPGREFRTMRQAKAETTRLNDPWQGLPSRPNSYGAAEQAAGSLVGRGRILLAKNTPDGVYKFVVDKNGQVWLAPAGGDVPHSALIPRGEEALGAENL